MPKFLQEKLARTLYVTEWGDKSRGLTPDFVKEVFKPFPKLDDVFIKTFPSGDASAFLTFDSVAAADNAFQMGQGSAKKTHGLNLRIRWRTTTTSKPAVNTTPPPSKPPVVPEDLTKPWKCPDPLCSKMNLPCLTNCSRCHCPRSLQQTKVSKAVKEAETLQPAAASTTEPPVAANGSSSDSFNQDFPPLVSKGRGKYKKNNYAEAVVGRSTSSDPVVKAGVRMGANLGGGRNSTGATPPGPAKTLGYASEDQFAEDVKELLSSDEKLKLLEIENETLTAKLEEAQAEITRFKTEEFERQLMSLSELWQELDVKTNGNNGPVKKPAVKRTYSQTELTQVLKDIRTVLSLEKDILASGEGLVGAHQYLQSCSAMEQRERDPDIRAKVQRSFEEARDIFKIKLQKHLAFYQVVSLNSLDQQIGSVLEGLEMEGGSRNPPGHISVDTINQVLNQVSSMPQLDGNYNDHNSESAVCELADKLVMASQLLTNKQLIIGLWLNASVTNALKVVDREYQSLTAPDEPDTQSATVVPALTAARGRVQGWMSDRDRTREMLASLDITRLPDSPPGNDSLEVAEILGGLGHTPTIATDW